MRDRPLVSIADVAAEMGRHAQAFEGSILLRINDTSDHHQAVAMIERHAASEL